MERSAQRCNPKKEVRTLLTSGGAPAYTYEWRKAKFCWNFDICLRSVLKLLIGLQ